MRPLARYAVTGKAGITGNPADIGAMSSEVREWLRQKGWDGSSSQFEASGGR